MRSRLILLILLASLATLPAHATPSPSPAPSRAAEAEIATKVSALMARMTLAEKIGQLNFPSLAFPYEDQLATVRQGRIGNMLNVVNPVHLRAFQDAARASRLKIPLLLAIDAIHAFHITFPTPIAWAATWRPQLAQDAAEMIARQTAQNGINLTFAPMIDISRDPRWGRVIEGAGEDPFLGSAFAAARVRGYRKGGLATAAKHFVGYGAPEGGRDYNGAQISLSELFDRYIPPFEAAIDAGTETVMASFNTVNGVPVTANRALITDILKERLGFEGIVMSDFAAIYELINHGVAGDLAEAARKALNAGIDLDMTSKAYERHLESAARAGEVPAAEIDAAVRRVLTVKYRMGLFPDSPGGVRKIPSPVSEASVRATARAVARESFVLLKNDGATLPITPQSGTVALIGAAALATSDHSWYGPAGLKKPETESLRDALESRIGTTQDLLFAEGFADPCGLSFKDKAGALAAARAANLVVLVVAEDCIISGEAASRADLGLTGVQGEMLDALAEVGKPIVLVVETGRPLALTEAVEKVAAVMVAWHPGTEGRTALAEVLTGEVAPSGKLPMTFPRSVGQVPISYGDLPTSRPATGDRYTTGYVDEKPTPLYPFGHGLSYTTFAYSDLKTSVPTMARNGRIEIRVDVTNTGTRAGHEVVQLYTRQLVAARSRPLRELKGFEKVALKPGQRRTVRFTLAAADLAYHDDEGRPVIEPGTFDVFVGGSSTADLEGSFEVTED
ncbi:glycoside hydrolase family 3 N-terminal domain-containing protein [Hyphomicrobium sp.]|uniref:glycoside hydrolase family 3 N-terminal domain-containing protein n=1 Tax=Hyphomicrobium sp. TaxID=82 RepID=UPI0025BDD536|nr:glycoside hydrolase family 3 N-terminal domain-containing protein [Hyphomicrobium sp.]MCC7254135.1 glycoside hydrolase family 3 C-terminal domain-containing protein [Hyphomicrobium sp.]